MNVRLAGEVYEPISFTSFTPAYDLYVQQVLSDAGVTELLTKREDLPENLREPAGKIFLRQLAYSGKLNDLYVAFIKPKGGERSVPWAIATAKKMEACTYEPEKR